VRTEVFGWMGSAAMGGAAIGSAVAGAIVESFGVRYVWLMAAVLAALSFFLLLRIPPERSEEAALPAGGLLGEGA
jgi:predicted MFS family arabinose efflux permease